MSRKRNVRFELEVERLRISGDRHLFIANGDEWPATKFESALRINSKFRDLIAAGTIKAVETR